MVSGDILLLALLVAHERLRKAVTVVINAVIAAHRQVTTLGRMTLSGSFEERLAFRVWSDVAFRGLWSISAIVKPSRPITFYKTVGKVTPPVRATDPVFNTLGWVFALAVVGSVLLGAALGFAI